MCPIYNWIALLRLPLYHSDGQTYIYNLIKRGIYIYMLGRFLMGDFTLGGLIWLDYLTGDFTLGGLIQLD